MNKQIEEIVVILETSGAISYEPNAYRLPSEGFIDKFFVSEREGRLTIDYVIFANAIVKSGFRRQEDVAREIFAEIEKEIEAALESNYKIKRDAQDMNDTLVTYVEGKIACLRGIDGFIAELKKKYEVKTE